MTTGIAILLLSALAYVSNWINWKYLNSPFTRYSYILGALIHETAHACIAVLTGAKVTEFSIRPPQPHVTHTPSKLPFIGNALIALAPFIVCLSILSFFHTAILSTVPPLSLHFESLVVLIHHALAFYSTLSFSVISGIILFLLLNIGAMLGPSYQDLKHAWVIVLPLLFFDIHPLTTIALQATLLILYGIILQAGITILIYPLKAFFQKTRTS